MGEQLIIVKKIKFQKKLSLNKETVAKLNEEQMEQANGGWQWPSFIRPNGFPGVPRIGDWHLHSQLCDASRGICPASAYNCRIIV